MRGLVCLVPSVYLRSLDTNKACYYVKLHSRARSELPFTSKTFTVATVRNVGLSMTLECYS